MGEDVVELLREYAARFNRGERPDVDEYLARAGEDAERLAALIDRFLHDAVPPEPSEERVRMLAGWLRGDPPLLELRRSRGLKREAVVGALVKALGLDPRKRAKVARYYHELETGLLDADRVDRRVFAALAAALQARVEELLAWSAPPRQAKGVYLRAAEPATPAAIPPPPAEQAAEEWDEIDRLFRGGR